MKFPPVNLWSKPRQPSLEEEMAKCQKDIDSFSLEKGSPVCFYLALLAIERLQELEFIYYCRNGHFPGDKNEKD